MSHRVKYITKPLSYQVYGKAKTDVWRQLEVEGLTVLRSIVLAHLNPYLSHDAVNQVKNYTYQELRDMVK